MNRRLLIRARGWIAMLALLVVGSVHAAPLLWVIEDSDSKLYLAGSLHLLPESAYPLDPALEQAYADTERLVLEADLKQLESPTNQTMLLAAAQADTDATLRERIGDALYEDVRRQAERLGLPLFSLDSLKPWFVGLMLELSAYQQAGFRPEYGLDQHFSQRAIADEKPILGLETVDEHMSLLVGLGDNGVDSTTTLAATLSQFDAYDDLPNTVYTAWRTGDLDAMAELVETMRTEQPAAYERLLANRNQRWVSELSALLDGASNVLVVVGAAHLPGEHGLLALMRTEGLEPRRVD